MAIHACSGASNRQGCVHQEVQHVQPKHPARHVRVGLGSKDRRIDGGGDGGVMDGWKRSGTNLNWKKTCQLGPCSHLLDHVSRSREKKLQGFIKRCSVSLVY